MRQPTSVLVYPFRRARSAWEVLLLRRVPRPDLGLEAFWQGVTGGLEGDETIAQAAARELREETGFTAQRLEAIGYSYSFFVRDAQRALYAERADEVTEHVFLAVIDPGSDPRLSSEHDQWRWCDPDTALKLLHWKNNIEGLRRCAARLPSA